MNTKIAFILIALLFTTFAFGQKTIRIDEDETENQEIEVENQEIKNETQEIKTLFSKEKRDGFYGSLSVGYSPIDHKDGVTASMRGCWIMDHFFSLGVGGTAFVNGIDQINFDLLSSSSNNENNLAGGYGGVIFEPILLPLKPIHLSFPIMVGVGAASSFDYYEYYSSVNVSDFFWVIEPTAELEINFTRWMRLALYASYRYTSELEIENISKDALRSYSAGITVKVGLF
jgi:hypothetical protein